MLINTPINNANQRRLPFIIMFAGLKVPFYTNRRVWKPSLSWKGYSAILHSKSFVVPWQRVAWSPSSVCGSNLCYRRRRVCVVHQANRHTMMAAWGCPHHGRFSLFYCGTCERSTIIGFFYFFTRVFQFQLQNINKITVTTTTTTESTSTIMAFYQQTLDQYYANPFIVFWLSCWAWV